MAWGASTTRCIHHRSGAWSHFSRMLVVYCWSVPLGLASTALWSSSREIGAKKKAKTQSSSGTTSSGNENVPGPVKTASSSKKGLTSQGL